MSTVPPDRGVACHITQVHTMEFADLNRNHLQEARNVLVLAPLTPWGTRAFTSLLAAQCREDTDLVVVTYTQPPALWFTEWNEQNHVLPRSIAFIHGGRAEGETLPEEAKSVSTRRVSPTNPMDIITNVSQVLRESREGDVSAIVSVQTLTVLLEYVEFETAFRYLHVLIHRIRGNDARGYYQMDPRIHDPETVNTLGVLFDLVIRPEEVDDEEIDWFVVRAVSNDDTYLDTIESSQFRDAVLRPLEVVGDWIARLRESTPTGIARIQPGESTASANHQASIDHGVTEDESLDDSRDEALLTDEERIERLLRKAGGRMSQADIVENTDWSGPTVSRKLSSMEEKGFITRIQVGRGNLVFLDGHQPDITRSQLEDDNGP